MEYILSAALLVLNLIDYERDLGYIAFTAAGTLLFVLLFALVYRKTKNFLATCLIMMCHTWQISWINIFGDPTANLQLPWFYIIGAMIVVYGAFSLHARGKKGYSPTVLAIFFIFLILFNYPLAISKSFSEGLKEYIMIGFFVLVLLSAYILRDEVPRECYEHVKSAFIWAAVSTSVLLIFQYVMYSRFGITLFKLSLSKYFNNYQLSCRLLMEDQSCSTIMLGCAAFYIADRIKKRTWMIYVPTLLLVLVALALTSRRTSTMTLAVVAMLFVYFHFKGIGKKLVFTIVFGIGVAAMMYYLFVVRPIESFSQAIYDNGRFENYLGAIDLIGENPLGYGYDGEYLASLMPNGIIPHNTILRWACMGGIGFPIPLVALIAYVMRCARLKGMKTDYWVLLYTGVAANFIPDILNARYFIIPCALVFVIDMRDYAPGMPLPPPPDIDVLPDEEQKEKVSV